MITRFARRPLAAYGLPLLAALVAGCGTTPAPPPPSTLVTSSSAESAVSTRGAPAASDAAETRRLHALFEAHWEATLRRNPEWATYLGDHRYDDRWRDASPAAIAAEYDAARQVLAQARAVRRDALSAIDRTSLDVLVHDLDDQLRGEPQVGFRSMTLSPVFGFHTAFSALLQATPMAQPADAENVLARMAAYPKRIDQEVALLREGLRLRWVPSRGVLERVLSQIDGQLAPALDDSPFFEPFKRLPRDLPPAQQEFLRERARRAIGEQVQPALRRLRAFVVDAYLPAAPADGGLAGYPDGAAVYAERVRVHTTTALTAAQIHATGLREGARLRGEMEAVMGEVGFPGDFAAFVRHLHTDPRFFHPSPDALLTGYRDIAKRIDPELPRLFARLPRTPYGVRAMPAHFDEDAVENYSDPALDGSRPGWFEANAKGFAKRPIWAMETLVAHEAVPGHHLQMATAIELGELPSFRRAGSFTAYVEGWALYAETLGFDLGLYKDPASRFGHLQGQAWRAARLVVDTGIHATGWGRQRAIDYMVERVGLSADIVAAEVDRYTAWPGQALAYMVGELKIIELRDRAKAALGERFDIRQFHQVVLDGGAVPLPVLERAVDEWIAAVAATAR